MEPIDSAVLSPRKAARGLLPTLGTFLALGWMGVTVSAGADVPMPIINFTFDSNPAANSETSLGTSKDVLSFKDSSGTPANLHSAAGLGVSGQPTDYAFDNSASSSMGSPGPGGLGFTAAASWKLAHLQSFTLTGWFKTDKLIGDAARILDASGGGNNGINLLGKVGTNSAGVAGSSLTLSVNGVSVTSDPSYTATGSWTFFAVTYDGAQSAGNLIFYSGSAMTPVSVVSTGDLDRKAADISLNVLEFGNRKGQDRPFLGYLDDFKIFGSTKDATGALTADQIQAICTSDTSPKPVPAPVSPSPAAAGPKPSPVPAPAP